MPSSAPPDDLSVGDVFSPQADSAQPSVETPTNHHVPDVHMGDRLSPRKQMANYAADGLKAMQPPAFHPDLLSGRQRRKKKKKQAAQADPARSTVHGFTPLASADEDSDFSATSSRAAESRPATAIGGASPLVQPASGHGVSALKLQFDSLLSLSGKPTAETNGLCSATPSNASVYSDSDQTEVLTSYEVPLEHDFVSADAAKEDPTSVTTDLAGNGINVRNQLCRKMTTEDFEPLLCLGKGSFGTVLLVRHVVTGKLYAQKQFKKASITVHKKLVEQTKTERMVLESVNRHPFVVKLFYAFQDHEKLYLILEYAQGGELFTHLAMERMFQEDAAAFYMAEMVLALEHLHQNVGVLYRDLKPENCLLDREGHLLLTDFGLSKIALSDDDRCNSSLGTIEYMAPEVVQGKPYGKACDWWSLEKIVKQKLVLPYFLGPDAKDLLTRLMRKEPSKRLGYHMPKDLQTIKKHRFFRKIDWAALERREVEPPIQPIVTDPALAENFSADFTQIPLSPIVGGGFDDLYASSRSRLSSGFTGDADPFGGFSFVASSSLLDHGLGAVTAGY
ncbi:Serine/threonine-protein kinase psk1 [Penicillium macrosclerotiorum]|uniref:Serine/threonine-protein kinase psk1 n=1 Tax=Penicillium macrosclerotiorum TaxID=303699 RepID=UPI0025486FDE|nr:Serine/threonine-protein kinase psk1 [Penicillium macrosclerotiorum]KAJ5683345.1 Serine/threonine-protein kinase psk1 [Penicillium macrosclerotiorum]